MRRHLLSRIPPLWLESLEPRDVPVTLEGITNSNSLVTLNSTNPKSVTTIGTITGLTGKQTIVAIATQTTTGQLYGLGFDPNNGPGTGIGEIYTINPNTAKATPVGTSGPFSTGLQSTSFGMSFDPVAGDLRVTSSIGGNYEISPTTGQIVVSDTMLSDGSGTPPTVTAIAYTPLIDGATTTSLYGYDYLKNSLVTIGSVNGSPNSPSSGIESVIGQSGLSMGPLASELGLTFGADGTAYLNAVTQNGTDGLYTLNLTTGTATLVGTISGNNVLKLAVAPPGQDQLVQVSGGTDGNVQLYTSTSDTTVSGTPTVLANNPFAGLGVDVRTAIGDVNGDGIPDYILATGPGTEFKVAVISGAPGNPVLVAPFDPFLPAPPEAQSDVFTAGGFVSAGDFLGNGRDQIVISPDQSGGPRVAIYDMNGATAAGSQPYTAVGVNTEELNPGSGLTRINNFISVNPNFRGGARTAVGDLNGDGVPDLAIAAGYGGGPAVLVINGTQVPTTSGLTASDDLIGDFFAFNSSLRDGAYLAIGDVLGNGQQDLILGPGDGGPAEVVVVSGQQLLTEGAITALASPLAQFVPTGLGPNGSGLRVGVTTNADGTAFVVVGAGKNMPGVVKVYPGSGFTSGSTIEPTGGQLLSPYNGATLADGIFVG